MPAIAVAVALLAVGVLAWTFVRNGRSGAGTPEDAVTAFVEAINNKDNLALVESIAPSETVTLKRVVDVLIQQGIDNGMLSSTGDEPILNLSIDATRVSELSRKGDMAIVEVEGSALLEDVKLPGLLGSLIQPDVAFDLEALGDGQGGSLEIYTVKEDGRWYVSLVSTLTALAANEIQLPFLDLAELYDLLTN